MKLSFWWIGKTNERYLSDGISVYKNRLKHYVKFDINEFKDVSNKGEVEKRKDLEAIMIIKQLDDRDFLILCDENGTEMSSVSLARHFEKWIMNSSYRRIIILVGGAYGVSNNIKNRANIILSLSQLTFSHQMVRLFLLEQVYRAFTIINNEKYHNI